MMKRFLSALLCACLIVPLAGCAGEEQGPPQDLLYSSAPIQFNSEPDREELSSESPEPEENRVESSSSAVQASSSQTQSSSSSAVSSRPQSPSSAVSSSSQAASQSSSSRPVSQSSSSQSSSSPRPSANNSVTAPSGELRGSAGSPTLDLASMIKQKSRSEFESAISKAFSRVAEDGYNTVFVQVRPFGDALYSSELFPWSRSSPARRGASVRSASDRDQAHARGLGVEAWVYPLHPQWQQRQPASEQRQPRCRLAGQRQRCSDRVRRRHLLQSRQCQGAGAYCGWCGGDRPEL